MILKQLREMFIQKYCCLSKGIYSIFIKKMFPLPENEKTPDILHSICIKDTLN